MSRTLSFAILATLVARTAAAEPPATPAPDEKSPGYALGLSIGVTAVGVGLTYVGAESNSDATELVGLGVAGLGPTAGHWYAGEPFTWGLGARLLGVGVFALGLSQYQFDFDFCFQEVCPPQQPPPDNTAAGVFMIAGAVIFGGGAIYDIVTAPAAADDYNARHALSVTPTVLRDARGDATPGFALVGTF
jgi:hypothetical protein